MPEAEQQLLYLDPRYRPEIPPSYLVFVDSADGLAKAKNGTTGIVDLQDASPLTVLQFAVNNAPNYGVVYVKAPFVVVGTLTIARGMITITSGIKAAQAAGIGGVEIPTIVIDSNVTLLVNVVLHGLYIEELNFYGRTNAMEGLTVEKCAISSDNGRRGIIFSGNQSVMSVNFIDCHLKVTAVVANYGMITFANTRADTGQIYFSQCIFFMPRLNTIVFQVADGGSAAFVTVDECSFDLQDTSTLINVVAATALTVCTFIFSNIHPLEVTTGKTLTLVAMANSNNSTLIPLFKFHHMLHLEGNVVLMNNLAQPADYASPGCTLDVDHCYFIVGQVSAGTLGTNDNFIPRIHDNIGYNPRGNIATPYPVAAGYLTDAAAAQAFPTSNTNYTVAESPKLITIYGGTVTSISIDGVATGLTSGAFALRPGQILNVVWTGQPSSVIYAQ